MAIDPGRVKALFQAAIERDDPDRAPGVPRPRGRRRRRAARPPGRPAGRLRPPPGALDRPLGAEVRGHRRRRPTPPGPPPAVAGEAHADGPTVDLPGRRRRRPSSAPSSPAGTSSARRSAKGAWARVYLAEQTQPVKRQVALKLIKPGWTRGPSWPGSSPSGRPWR